MSVAILTAEERKQGLGGTDVAAIVGVSTYRSPIEVYLEKRGEAPAQEQTWRMRLGQIFEDAIAEAYAEKTGRKLARVGVVRHKAHPFLYVHPDRTIIGEPGLVECKKTDDPSQYAGGPPPRVKVQCQWQMGLTGRLWVDVVRPVPGDIAIDRIERDQDLIDDLIEAAVDFWEQLILRGIPPDIDGTDAYRRFLQERFPREEVEERVATAEQVLLLDEWHRAAQAYKAAETHKKLVENRIAEAMGDAGRLLSPMAVASYRWQEGYIVKEHVVKGSRRLRIYWKGEGDG